MSHTPGPWHVGGTNDQIIYNGNGYAVANTCVFHGVFDEAEPIANASLIAAAPDLLEALVEALPYVEMAEHDDAYKPGAVAKVAKRIRAAIAKASNETVPS